MSNVEVYIMPNSFSGIGGWEAIDADWRDSKQGINDSITALQQAVANFGSYAVVASIGDVSDPNTKTIYLVKDTTQTGTDKYQEYICTDTTTSPATFELIGDTTVDLSQYYTKTETSSVSELSTEFGNKLDSSVAASTYLTQSSADTLYYPLSNNPSGYLTEITGDFSGNNVSATTVNLKYIKNDGGYYYTSAVELNAGNLCFQKSNPGTSEGTTDINADNIQLAGGGGTDAAMTMKHNEIYINSQGSQQCVKITPSYIEAISANHVVSASWYDLISYITAHM